MSSQGQPERLILASASPRRTQLLRQMALMFDVVVTDIDETLGRSETPRDYVARLARTKAQAGWQTGALSLGADTIVCLDDEILGKPRGQTEGAAMLRALSARTHEVFTGIAVTDGIRTESAVVVTRVTFRALSDVDIAAYLTTGEGNDKAGSYGIQGIGGIFVERIEGSFSAVMGLPVLETEHLLTSFNFNTWSMRDQWLKNS